VKTFGDYWNLIYSRNGNRIIATRSGKDYLQSGERDLAVLLQIAGEEVPLGRVLEIGAGNGRMSNAVAQSAAELVCLEPASNLALDCESRLCNFPNSRVIVGSSEALSALPNQSFDLIFSWCVFQHIRDSTEIEKYIYETGRLLSPTGIAIHQFRQRSPYVLFHQVGADVMRIPSRMPKFHPHWRGSRHTSRAVTELAARLAEPRHSHHLITHPVHHWLLIASRDRLERLLPQS
jgi:ubiquinone/menaquinone biosynthesis C-methylase UbiE